MKNIRKKIAILCSDDSHHKFLINELTRHFQISLIVEEPANFQRKRLWRKKKFRDYFFSTYHSYRRKALGLNHYRRKYFKIEHPIQQNTAKIIVNSINSKKVINAIKTASPDIAIVMGTSIIGSKILNEIDTFINIHGGYLPDYRGNHCFFFPLLKEDYSKIGSTIHFVNKGIDKGDIIEVISPPIKRNDNAEKLYSRAEKIAIHRLVFWLKKYESGIPLPRTKQAFTGNLYRTRDRNLYHDLKLWVKRIIGIQRLPTINETRFISGDKVVIQK